ncbi:hypothetical protein LZD49_17300 [Dyadobacter sp. CY261]|uniref:hypothetical protein n=1 Tax=Dyadobacter sp. CY261 TaxID=2907203 RepID=UPI001F30D7CB|nr:hypothetical protein [Dyadobacter sp. CY261]MCF0072240.1 hypothetical protein [Dyadobacter sp. CY261]
MWTLEVESRLSTRISTFAYKCLFVVLKTTRTAEWSLNTQFSCKISTGHLLITTINYYLLPVNKQMRNYSFAVYFVLLGMLACAPVPSRTKENIFRYIDIGNDYRLLLGDKIEKHLAILKPVGLGYKLTGEGYGDASSIFIQVSEEGKIERFQFLYDSEISKQSKIDNYKSMFGAPMANNTMSIWRDRITELQVTNLPDGSLVIYLVDISKK